MTTYTTARTPAQEQYARYLRSPRWRLIRWLRRHLDGGHCTEPGCKERTRLEVHHKRYDNRGGSFLRELMDCETLCAEHHGERHGEGR